MEFAFDIQSVLAAPISVLTPQNVPRSPERLERLVEIVDELGRASAIAQGLRTPVTTFAKLCANATHQMYILRRDAGSANALPLTLLQQIHRDRIAQQRDDKPRDASENTWEPFSVAFRNALAGPAGRPVIQSGAGDAWITNNGPRLGQEVFGPAELASRRFQAEQHSAAQVVGFIKIGQKTLYMADEHGRVRPIQPICVLDFYVHESCHRRGYGRTLINYMLDVQGAMAHELAYDRPSHKLFRFLAKNFGLSQFIQQSNNFVVFRQYQLGRAFDLQDAIQQQGRFARPQPPTAAPLLPVPVDDGISPAVGSSRVSGEVELGEVDLGEVESADKGSLQPIPDGPVELETLQDLPQDLPRDLPRGSSASVQVPVEHVSVVTSRAASAGRELVAEVSPEVDIADRTHSGSASSNRSLAPVGSRGESAGQPRASFHSEPNARSVSCELPAALATLGQSQSIELQSTRALSGRERFQSGSLPDVTGISVQQLQSLGSLAETTARSLDSFGSLPNVAAQSRMASSQLLSRSSSPQSPTTLSAPRLAPTSPLPAVQATAARSSRELWLPNDLAATPLGTITSRRSTLDMLEDQRAAMFHGSNSSLLQKVPGSHEQRAREMNHLLETISRRTGGDVSQAMQLRRALRAQVNQVVPRSTRALLDALHRGAGQ